MYSTSLTDSQWEVIEKYLPIARKRKYSLRSVVDGIFFLLKTGCQWRMLPHDFPPHQLVYYYFSTWTRKGLWEKINKEMNQLYRLSEGKEASPSLAIIDAQTVKNSERGLNDTGFDGNKRIKGRKRHLAVDTLGLVLAVSYSAANTHDSQTGSSLLLNLFHQGYDRIKQVLADAAYRGKLQDWCSQELGWHLQIATAVRGNEKSFHLQPQRWKVERSISWLQWCRRLAKDYEANMESGVAFVLLHNIRRILHKF